MTKLVDDDGTRGTGRTLPVVSSGVTSRRGPGRPREFCSQRCRQWDWVARQRARELQLSDDELVVARAELDGLHDELYVLACAVEDVERDLGAPGRRTVTELTDAVDWLLAAARPLRDREITPSA